jgi:hypothetical protein
VVYCGGNKPNLLELAEELFRAILWLSVTMEMFSQLDQFSTRLQALMVSVRRLFVHAAVRVGRSRRVWLGQMLWESRSKVPL